MNAQLEEAIPKCDIKKLSALKNLVEFVSPRQKGHCSH